MKKIIIFFVIFMLFSPLTVFAQKKKFSPEKAEEENKVEKQEVAPPELIPIGPDKKKTVQKKKNKTKPVEPKPVEPKLVEPKLVEPKPVEPKPVEPKLVEPKLVEPKAVEPKLVEPKAVEPKLVEPKAVEPKLVEQSSEKEERVKQYYFDSPTQLEDRESGHDIFDRKEPIEKKKRFFNETSTSKLPFSFSTLPSTAYGTGIFTGGNSDGEHANYIEGIKVPFTHHPLFEKSVIDRNMLKNNYFYSGNFGPELGDSIGGVSNLSFRDTSTDKIGGTFDLSMFGLSMMAEGPVAKSNYFSISFDFNSNNLFTRIAYDDKNSIVTEGDLGGHLRYVYEVDNNNSVIFTVVGAKNSFDYLASLKNRNVPIMLETLSPETMFILAKGDYVYKSSKTNSKLTGSFVLSNYDYMFFGGEKFSTIDNRGTLEEHLSFKINEDHRFDLGVIFAAGIFSTDTSFTLLPLEGESGRIRSVKKLEPADNIGYIHPSMYLKYCLNIKGFEAVPGLYISGDFHNKKEWSGTVDPRLFIGYNITKWLKIYGNGGIYSKRPQYDLAFFKLGKEELGYEKAVHSKLGLAFDYEGFFADASGFYKYFYDLIRRSPEKVTTYENTGTGWAAGTEIKIGYSNKELFGWVSYTYIKSMRKDNESLKERKADGHIPHILKAALSYNFLKNWTASADISVASGTLVTPISQTLFLDDEEIYLPLFSREDVNSIRLSNSIRYGFKLDYSIFFKEIILGIYGDIRGSNAKIDIVYNRDYSESGGLFLAPVLGTVGIRGEF